MNMYRKWKKRTAACLALALSVSLFTSCGNLKKEEDPDSMVVDMEEGNTEESAAVRGEEEQEDSDAAAEEGESGQAMGRYLESDVQVPEGCSGIMALQFLDSGKLRVCCRDSDYHVVYADSGDCGETWEENISIDQLLGAEAGSVYYAQIGKDGSIFAHCPTQIGEGENGFGEYEHTYYYISPEGEARELPVQDLLGGWISNTAFTSQGTLLALNNGIVEIDPTDGSLVKTYEKGASLVYFCLAGQCLIAIDPDGMRFYDLESGNPMESMDALAEQFLSDSDNRTIMSTSAYPALFAAGDEKDSLFYVDRSGMYRYSYGGSIVEKIMDTGLNSLSSPDIALAAMDIDQQGAFYIAVMDYSGSGGKAKILKYVYSEDTPTVPDTELTVYALRDNDFLRQAAVAFRKKYPDVYLTLKTGMSGDDAVTSTDALRTLNTEIMAGQGPDVLIMDGMPLDAYIEQGMLEDLSSIVGKVRDTDGILENIRKPFEEEDGSIRVFPLKFGIPMIQGKKEDVETVTDLQTLADVVEAHESEYQMEPLSYSMPVALIPQLLIECLADVCAPAWMKEDGTLDEQALSDFYTQAERIYRPTREMSEDWEEERNITPGDVAFDRALYGVSGSSLSLLGGYIRLGIGGLYSTYDIATMTSVEKKDDSLASGLWNGQAQNCFIPMNMIGISAKAREKETAEIFLEFLLSQEGQAIGDEGFSVNQALYDSQDYWVAGNGEDIIAVTSSSNIKTGEEISLDICQPDKETYAKIRELGKSLTVSSALNVIVLNAVEEAGIPYLKGETSLEEAVRMAVQEVNLYLSE